MRNQYNTFFKGLVGGGGLTGGDLDDEDYFAGQVKLSDTSSKLDGNGLLYGTMDVGQRFAMIDRRALGRSMSSATASAAIPIGNAACPVGLWWCRSRPRSSVRLGGELRVTFWDRLTLIGDAAFLPVAYVCELRQPLFAQGPRRRPNIEDCGSGWGYQLEAEARYDFTAALVADFAAHGAAAIASMRCNDPSTTSFVHRIGISY